MSQPNQTYHHENSEIYQQVKDFKLAAETATLSMNDYFSFIEKISQREIKFPNSALDELYREVKYFKAEADRQPQRISLPDYFT